jgi:type III pantothenate kinase
MTSQPAERFVAVDVGNTRVKFGLFDSATSGPLPLPSRTLDLLGLDGDLERLRDWLAPYQVADLGWWIASVNRPAATRLIDWLREAGLANRTRLLASFDLPLVTAVNRPDMVGIDRLLGCVGANVLRAPDRPAVVVDLGTAITVDLVSHDGAFLGGAILPGIGMSARALHEFTDLLPLLEMHALAESPAPVGTSTLDAMRSGLFWGAVGAARELIDRFSAQLPAEPQIFLTGGAAASVASLISPTATYAPHLVLGGIALAVAHSPHETPSA